MDKCREQLIAKDRCLRCWSNDVTTGCQESIITSPVTTGRKELTGPRERQLAPQDKTYFLLSVLLPFTLFTFTSTQGGFVTGWWRNPRRYLWWVLRQPRLQVSEKGICLKYTLLHFYYVSIWSSVMSLYVCNEKETVSIPLQSHFFNQLESS